ncbi:hypothetical protein BG61_20610 [Caballeronia glathei]|uniref:Uncharacterized protein n=1 Tax=Caballeronia glathei TaxID=60547 RepID=A0A069PLB7_9BURK|nr:hypothetical protein BG61_20610 [Caballeronia glathei]
MIHAGEEAIVSLDTMSFILGGILVAAGLFGGGLEIKELKLPQIGIAARYLSVGVGVCFVVLAIYVKSPQLFSEKESKVTFQEPMQGDLRLDACLEWGKKCGEPAATAWCKTHGMSRASDYRQENVGNQNVRTRLISTSQVCSEAFCASFAYIVCEK